jgi:hypothetical protein
MVDIPFLDWWDIRWPDLLFALLAWPARAIA